MLQSWQMGTENIQVTRLRKLILKTLHIHKVSETLPLIVTEMLCELHSHTENVSVSTCRVENTDVWSRNNNQQQRQTSFLLFKLFSRSVLSFVWWILSFYDSEVSQPVAFLNEVEMQLLVCLNLSQTVCHTTMYRWYSINSLTVYEPQKSLLCIENLRWADVKRKEDCRKKDLKNCVVQ